MLGAAQSSAASPEVKLTKRVLAVGQAGNMTVKLSCPAGEAACLGSVTLKSRAFKKKAIASAPFIIVGGRAKGLNLHLGKKALARLKRRHSLHASARILARDPAGASHTTVATVTLKLA